MKKKAVKPSPQIDFKRPTEMDLMKEALEKMRQAIFDAEKEGLHSQCIGVVLSCFVAEFFLEFTGKARAKNYEVFLDAVKANMDSEGKLPRRLKEKTNGER